MITTKKIDPRPYQQKAAAAIHREWDAGNKKTLVVMPTGTGKTIVFASIVNDQVEKGEHVLILAHREELLQQASDKLKMVTGLETALEKAQNSALDSDKMVVVASVQTLSSLYAQIVGRGTRLCEGKKNLLVLDFLWLTKKHSLCHPADIFCEDPEVAQKTTDMLADAALTGSNSQENFGSPELGLIEAIEEAQTELDEEKRKALCELEKQDTIQRKLKAQRQKPRGLVDPLQYIFSIEAPELNDYQPMFESERQEPSDDIIDSISCYGVKGDAIKSQGLAAAILKRLIARRASGMATPKQIRCLESFGFVHVGRWTLRYASGFLDIISSHDWKLPNGFDASTLDPEKNTAEDLAKLYPDYKEDETKKAPRGDAFICCYYDASYNLARKKVCNSEKEMLNLYYSLFNTCEAKYFYYTKEADAWMAEKQNLIARKTGTPIPAAQPTQATPAVPPPFVPTAPAKSHEYYCCLARWDGSYIGYETYKSEQAAQNARKQIARRGETAVYATVEEAEAWVEQQKAARTRR